MRKTKGKKYIRAVSLVVAFIICAVFTIGVAPKMSVSAEDHFAGRIAKVDLTVDAPAIGYINGHNWSNISYSASLTGESSGYEIFTEQSAYATQFKMASSFSLAIFISPKEWFLFRREGM